MRLAYTGCNLFGQVVTSSQLRIVPFQPFLRDSERSDFPQSIDVDIGHSFIALKHANTLELHGHGFSPRQTRSISHVDFPSEIRRVRSSDTRIAVVLSNGSLLCLDFRDVQPQFMLKSFSALESDDKLVDFLPGPLMNVALTEKDFIYVGQGAEFTRTPFALEEGASVKKICAGYEHVVLLDSLGRIYSFGNGRRGQLGHGEIELETSTIPQQIQSLAGIRVVDVDCCGWHSMALSEDGDVYVWGWNSDGQLGLVDEDTHEPISLVPGPQYLPIAHEYNIAHIACGGRHSVCVTSDNKVYAFGCNKSHQLGLNGQHSRTNVPTKVLTMLEAVSKVVCGPASTMLLHHSK